MSERRKVKLKTMDNCITELIVEDNISIAQLKKEIEKKFNKTPNEQRLIYKGKQMKDCDLLKQYITEDNQIIHLLFKLLEDNGNSHNNNETLVQVSNGIQEGNNSSNMTMLGGSTANSLILEVPCQNGRIFIPIANRNARQGNLNFNLMNNMSSNNTNSSVNDYNDGMNNMMTQETQNLQAINLGNQPQQRPPNQTITLATEIPLPLNQQMNISELINQLTQGQSFQVNNTAIPNLLNQPIQGQEMNANIMTHNIMMDEPMNFNSNRQILNSQPNTTMNQSPFISLLNRSNLLPPNNSDNNNNNNYTTFNSTIQSLNDQNYHLVLNSVNKNISRLYTLINNNPDDLSQLPILPILNSNQNFFTALSRTMRNYSLVLNQSMFSLIYLSDLFEREQYISQVSQRRLGNALIPKCALILHYIDIISKETNLILNRTNFGFAPNQGYYLLNGLLQGIVPINNHIAHLPSPYNNDQPIIENIPNPDINRSSNQTQLRANAMSNKYDLKIIMNSEEQMKTIQLKDLGIVVSNSNKTLMLFAKQFIANLTIKEIIELTHLNLISIARQRKELDSFIQLLFIEQQTENKHKSIVDALVDYISNHFFLYQCIEHRIKQPNSFQFNQLFNASLDPLIKLLLNTVISDVNWEEQLKDCIINIFSLLVEGLSSVYMSKRDGVIYCLENNIEGLLKEIVGNELILFLKEYLPNSIRLFTETFISLAECKQKKEKNQNEDLKESDVNSNESLTITEIFGIVNLDKKRIEDKGEQAPIEFSELYRNTNTIDNQ